MDNVRAKLQEKDGKREWMGSGHEIRLYAIGYGI